MVQHIGVTGNAMARISRAVKKSEQTLQPLPQVKRRVPTPPAAVIYAKNITAIQPGTFEAPTQFTADIWLKNSAATKPRALARSTVTSQLGIKVSNPWKVSVTTINTQLRLKLEGDEYVLDGVDNC